MKTLLKWTFLSALLLAVLAGIGIAIILFVIDPNEYKPQIQQLAKEQGVDLNINGDLGWQIWPNIAIAVGETELSGANLPNIQFKQANLVLKLSALLAGDIAVNEVSLQQPRIRIDTGKPGAAGQAAAIAVAPVAAAGTQAPQDSGIALNIQALSVSDGIVELLAGGAVQQRIDNLQIDSRQVNLSQQRFPLEVSFDTTLANVAEQISITLQGDVQVDSNFQLLALSESTLQLTANSKNYGNHQLLADFGFVLDLAAGSAQLPNLKMELDGVPVQLSAKVDDFNNALSINGKLDIPTFDPNDLLAKLGFEGPPIKKLGLATTFSSTEENYVLSDLTLQMDEFTLWGNASANLKNQRVINIKVSGTTLNLDRYLPPTVEQDQNTDARPADALLAPLLAPLAALNGGKGQVDISLKQLITQGLQLDNLRLTANSNGALIRVNELSADGFGGNVKGNMALDLSGKQPVLNMETQATGVNLHTVLTTFADFTDLSGTANLTIKAAAKGNTAQAIKESINANGTFSAQSLELAGMNVEKSYCDMAALVERETREPRTWPNLTRFIDTTGAFQLRGQQATFTEVKSGIGNLRITSNGSANLAAGEYNTLVTANLQGDRTSETGCRIKSTRIRNRDIPIRCRGKFEGDVSCAPDQAFVQKLLTEKISNKLLEKLLDQKEPAEQTDETNTEQKNPLENLLKGLIKKKEQ